MEAKRDENHVPTLQAVLNTDGLTPTNVEADPATNRLSMLNGTSGSDNGPTDAKRDGNYVTGFVAVSETDGETPVVLYVNSSGQLLIDSN